LYWSFWTQPVLLPAPTPSDGQMKRFEALLLSGTIVLKMVHGSKSVANVKTLVDSRAENVSANLLDRFCPSWIAV